MDRVADRRRSPDGSIAPDKFWLYCAIHTKLLSASGTYGGVMETETTDATGELAGEPIYVEGAGHLADLLDDHEVVLVDFFATWCGPCQMLEPTLETLAADSDATIAKVDVDAQPGLAAEYGVRGVPTLVLFANGKPVERVVGLQPEERLRSLIEEAGG